MFDLFSDPVKVAQQLEIIASEYGFAVWETLYALALEVLFAYVIGLPAGVLLLNSCLAGRNPGLGLAAPEVGDLPGGRLQIDVLVDAHLLSGAGSDGWQVDRHPKGRTAGSVGFLQACGRFTQSSEDQHACRV